MFRMRLAVYLNNQRAWFPLCRCVYMLQRDNCEATSETTSEGDRQAQRKAFTEVKYFIKISIEYILFIYQLFKVWIRTWQLVLEKWIVFVPWFRNCFRLGLRCEVKKVWAILLTSCHFMSWIGEINKQVIEIYIEIFLLLFTVAYTVLLIRS